MGTKYTILLCAHSFLQTFCARIGYRGAPTNHVTEYFCHMDNPNGLPERVGGGPRLAAAALDYLVSTMLVLVCAWQDWGWDGAVAQMPGAEELLELYAPMEAALQESGLTHGMMGLFGASAMMALLYPVVEALTGSSPGKWALGLAIASADRADGGLSVYMRRALVKYIRPVLATLALWTGVGLLAQLSGPAGLVVTGGTLFLLAPHKQALHDKLAGTAVYRRSELSG